MVDDDRQIVRLLRTYLAESGYQALVAYDGESALHLIRRERPDLVLLDLMMGDMSGWLVLQAVKSDARLQHIPVLIVSAKHQMEDPAQAEACAHLFKGYLVKPFVVQDLMSQIVEALA